MSEVPTGKAKRRVVSFGGENKKPPKPEGPPPSHAVRAKKTLNPVRKQPRPAASPGMPAEDPDDEPEPIKTTVNEEKDKNSAMSQIGSAIGNLWNWAKQKGRVNTRPIFKQVDIRVVDTITLYPRMYTRKLSACKYAHGV
eukprot:1390700-Amorphochlora_amoeboformis.AAC.1